MLKKIGLLLIILGLVAGGGFILWGSTPAGPSPEALRASASGSGVVVEDMNGWMVFRPDNVPFNTGLIFYPGGRVDYRSYAPVLGKIARQGYLVVVVPMPLNLAVFGVDKAGEVIKAFPEVSSWAVGGHSLGGSMAAQYALDHPAAVKGLVFWASYPAASLADRRDLAILSVAGSRDGLATPAVIEGNKSLLPPTTVYVTIEGGDHAQFGSYGSQSGDNPASIPAEQQWQETAQATVSLLQKIDGN